MIWPNKEFTCGDVTLRDTFAIPFGADDMTHMGYVVKLAADGLEAAELVTQHGCHLVITDLEMPRMTGYELMVQLRQNASTRRIPVMVVTSRAGAKHRDRALKEGAAAFLTKPVQEDQLLAAVEQLMGKEAERHLVPVS